MPAKRIRRSAVLLLALLMVAAVPARATTPPTFTVVDSIRPGSEGSYAMDLSRTGVLNGYLYFEARGASGDGELWRTNGTTTELVKSINSGSDSDADYFVAMGDALYFTTRNSTAAALSCLSHRSIIAGP